MGRTNYRLDKWAEKQRPDHDFWMMVRWNPAPFRPDWVDSEEIKKSEWTPPGSIDLRCYNGRIIKGLRERGFASVYVATFENCRPSFIARTTDIRLRILNLQSMSVSPLFLEGLYWVPSPWQAAAIERAAHAALESKRIRGNWFDLSAGEACRIIEATGHRMLPHRELAGRIEAGTKANRKNPLLDL
jgi:hypothetical protein